MSDAFSPPPAPGGEVSAEERQWGLFAHLSALCGFIIPFGSILAPLVIWQIKKDTMPFVTDQAKEALNFNITVAIAGLISWLLAFVLIGLLLLPIVLIGWVVFVVLAAIKANEGQYYRYPFALRLVK